MKTTIFIILSLFLTHLNVHCQQDTVNINYLNLSYEAQANIVVWATLDTGTEIIDLVKPKGMVLNAKITEAYPTPMYFLNYVCQKYDLEIAFWQKSDGENIARDRYDYLLVKKQNP